ncbi:hypothetical protein ABW19_dt0208150 [Dactylella cylindrospora]|nr:hypothetical protein ABW19_dt0208150 [Dactylella cylindrospora]
MTSTLPMASTSYTPPPLAVNSLSTLQTLPSPPSNEVELSKPNSDAVGHNSSSFLASRRQNVSLPAFTFPSPGQRTYGYGLHSPAPSLLTPPSGNDHISPVDSNNPVNAGFWAASASSQAPHSSGYSYGSSASSQPAYTTAPAIAAAPAYAARGIVSPVSTSSRSQPLSPNHQDNGHSGPQQPSFDGSSYASNLSVPATHAQSYATTFPYQQQGQMTTIPPNSLSSPHDAYQAPSSLPPPTPSSGYYAQHSPSYPYHGHSISVGATSPSAPRPPAGSSLSHLHSLHASNPLSHSAYQSAHQRYLPNGLPSNVYAQHGASIMGGLAPHLAGALPQHAHIHPSQHASVPHQERPFRCDQCPQSFNRNHDLKRHKRIHLAVKPFPCPNCDKSFSRKDALKRHVLVKGCGNAASASKSTTAAS